MGTATIYTDNGGVALVLSSLRREGDKLVIDGKALGTMRMDMIITPGEFFNTLKIVFSWAVISYLLLLPFFGLGRLFKR
jgi:hypothetical protein